MRRLIATAVIGVAVAGCGTSGHQTAAQQQCAKFKAEGQTFARQYTDGIPNVNQGTATQLAAASYQSTALSHGYKCN